MNRRTLFRSAAALTFAGALAACAPMAGDDIVDVASSNEDFSTLVAAVSAAGLVDTLKGPGPFTVFAPTNEALAAQSEGTVERLLKPENRDELVSILSYYVVNGVATSETLAGQRVRYATVNGETVHIDATGAGVTVENANVTAADIEASNGVIHVIDTVLLP